MSFINEAVFLSTLSAEISLSFFQLLFRKFYIGDVIFS